jgi:hypothetical protein
LAQMKSCQTATKIFRLVLFEMKSESKSLAGKFDF